MAHLNRNSQQLLLPVIPFRPEGEFAMHMRTIVVLTVGSAVAIWTATLYLSGVDVDWALTRPFSLVVGCVTLLAVFFETVLWRLPLVRSYISKRPTIAGTWRTTLVSNFKQADGSETVKTVYLVISQSLTRLSVRMYTDTAHSKSLAERISSSSSDDMFDLAIVYQNYPDMDQRYELSAEITDGSYSAKSKIHFGALHIPNLTYRPLTLKGHYWTDRRTEGMLTLEERRSKLVSSYREGVELFSQPNASKMSWLKKLFQPAGANHSETSAPGK